MQIQAGSIGLLTISFVIYRICTVEPDKSPRQLFRKKKAIAHPKKSKSLIITPGVDFEKPICSFLIVKKRFDEYSDSASKTISLLRKIQTNFSKRVFCFRTRRSIFAHFCHCRSCQVSEFFASDLEIFSLLFGNSLNVLCQNNTVFYCFFFRTRVI